MQGKRTRSFQDLAAGKVSAPEPRYSVTGHTTPQESVHSEADAKRSNLLASLMSQYLARGTLVKRSQGIGFVLWVCQSVGSGARGGRSSAYHVQMRLGGLRCAAIAANMANVRDLH